MRNRCVRREVMVRAAVCCCGGIVGPFFFNDSVTGGESNLKMLHDFFYPHIAARPRRLYAPPPHHFSRIVRHWLDETFEDNRTGPPDLAPCDFFLWAYLKSLLYRRKPTNVDDLKQKLTDACASIERETFDRSLVEFKKRMEKVIESDGGRIEHLPRWIALKFSREKTETVAFRIKKTA